MEVNHWHRMANLYLNGEIELSEIVKFYITGEAVELIEYLTNTFDLPYNVLDQSDLNDVLVYSILRHRNDPMPVTYQQIADILHMTPRVVGLAIKRLVKTKWIVKTDYGTGGSSYNLLDSEDISTPVWLDRFTKALLELHDDEQLFKAVQHDMQSLEFKHRFAMLRKEIRQKYRGKSQS